MSPLLPRHSLLPDLQHSRAVLVGCGDYAPGSPGSWRPEEMARDLAGALTSPDAGMAFDAAHTCVLVNPERPAEVFDAVRLAAGEASDTLLFYYAGTGSRHQGFNAAGAAGLDGLEVVAGLLGTSRAERSVVILDGAGVYWFKELTPTSFILAGSSFGSGDQLVPFTPTLVHALWHGVLDGPQLLDLVTLRYAIEASFYEARYFIEDHWVLGPASLTVRHPHRFRMVALGINPSFGVTDRAGTGALLRDEAALHEEYGW
ncbi:MAG TPA: hypothetical protein VFV66_22085 [Nonomuraea sp.]|nr:hypothetical protein [Nonomuraea sp.]